MGFGINKILKNISLKHINHIWKRNKIYNQHKGKNLKIGLGCSIVNVEIGKNNFIGNDTKFYNSSIGDYSYINTFSVINHTKIGKFCSIASGVKIVLGSHPTDLISLHPTFYANNKLYDTFSDKTYFQEYFNVEIGNDVWIGEEVMIPGGISIGDGAVIAARAVVTKDVAPYSVVGGVPAKHIRYRFNKQDRELLLKFKWWDKDELWLKKNFKKFQNQEEFFDLIKSL